MSAYSAGRPQPGNRHVTSRLRRKSSSAVDVLSDVFKLTEEERKRLSNFPVGQGLFFAGQNHVHIQIMASETEQGLITTNPHPSALQQPQQQPQLPEQQQVQTGGYTNPGERSV